MKNKAIGTNKSLIATILLPITLITILSGCINRPLLLRNRPNVPPPVIDPSYGETMMAVGEVDVITNEPPLIEIPESLPPPDIQTAPVTYTVTKGDSFWTVARMYGVGQDELASSNNLNLNKPLKIGTVLLIPPGGEFLPEGKRSVVKKAEPKKNTIKTPEKVEFIPSNNDGTYTVKKGDSLWKVARRYKLKTSLLAQANNLDIRKPLQIGQKLIIPSGGDADVTTTQKVPVDNDKKIKKPDVVEDPTEIINDDKSPADELLNDAVEGAKEPESTDKKVSGDAVDVLNEIEEAVKVAEQEIPGSLYTEEVLPNETLQEIAERHGFTPEQIRAVNPGLPADGKLKPFSSIKIPNK